MLYSLLGYPVVWVGYRVTHITDNQSFFMRRGNNLSVHCFEMNRPQPQPQNTNETHTMDVTFVHLETVPKKLKKENTLESVDLRFPSTSTSIGKNPPTEIHIRTNTYTYVSEVGTIEKYYFRFEQI